MADQNMVDFYGRVSRIKKARAKGYGFEAVGTLGRSYYTQHAPARSGISISPTAFSIAIVTATLFDIGEM